MIILYFLLGIITLSSGSVFYKMGAVRSINEKTSPALLCTIYFIIASLGYSVANALNGADFIPSRETLVCAIIGGVSFVAGYFYIIAQGCGPYTESATLINFSNFLPIIYCLVFPGETIGPMTLLGVVLMVLSVYFLTTRGKSGNEKKLTKRWVVLITLTVITNSVISYMIRVQEHFDKQNGRSETALFFAILFAVAAITALIIFFAVGGAKSGDKPLSLIPPAIGLAACIGGNVLTQSLLYKEGVAPAVQSPIINGGSLILSAVIGVFFFKDKLSKKAIFALVIGIAAIILLSL